VPDKRAWALPYLALVLNALVWGVSWWPLRELQGEGLHPLWSSAFTYLLGALAMLCFMPKVWGEFVRHKALWLLALAAGTTMVGFNWGVSIGEVIRVVLLFYLMPIWAVLIARVALNERITLKALLRVGLAFAGAVLVLSPNGSLGFPLPSNLAEWLGLMGGAAFALNNIMLRHQAERTAQARLFAMFVGGIVAPARWLLYWPCCWARAMPLCSGPCCPGFTVLVANYGLQYGASRLPANVTSVVMLSEVVFATLSAIVLTQEVLTLQVGIGGAMIVLAAALSALENKDAH
jgi:drug/metabolite transporter (DMT)-like permease